MSQAPIDARKLYQFASAYNSFGFQLLSQLTENNPNTNISLSPFSITIALVMLYNGARGDTKQKIEQVLGLEGLSLEDINTANQSLLSKLKEIVREVDWEYWVDSTQIEAEPDKLTSANSVWVKPGISLDKEFVRGLKTFYESEVAHLDFDSPEAATIINRWVAEKTKNKITKLVSEETLRDSVLILLNALYFMGIWSYPFDESKTENRTFTLSDESAILHPTMAKYMVDLDYLKTENFQAVQLPYEDESSGLYIFLPNASSSFEEFQTLLTFNNWQNWMSQFCRCSVNIFLPKLKLECRQLLNDSFSNLGLEDLFTNNANLSGIGAGSLKVSQLVHKVAIEVNEKGTEAAAVTEFEMIAFGVVESIDLIIDRPFFYAIYDRRAQTILFMGYVLNPASH
ncbi:serpin family protein [Oscillatoria sp. FACHB-1406]|uniref:serpin family protein n=1 Tax=Oscillatoria sp. FACHB-1406 TaxID=2692846 RepID=UPI0016828ABD|nr:serpin family protein [Oscillatoria sp. FACHB-1406]MBD2577961.1 serpin family protein [Oscillatoria sp. FACHB-1406]